MLLVLAPSAFHEFAYDVGELKIRKKWHTEASKRQDCLDHEDFEQEDGEDLQQLLDDLRAFGSLT